MPAPIGSDPGFDGSRFERVVLAIAEAIVLEHGGGADVRPQPVARFLLDTHARMPDYLRLPIRLLTLVFDVWGTVTTGRPFHRQLPGSRARQLTAWRTSRLSVRRDLVKFYETLDIFGLYAERYPQDYGTAQTRAEGGHA